MKRVFALIVTLVMICSLFVTANASGEKIYYPSDIKRPRTHSAADAGEMFSFLCALVSQSQPAYSALNALTTSMVPSGHRSPSN